MLIYGTIGVIIALALFILTSDSRFKALGNSFFGGIFALLGWFAGLGVYHMLLDNYGHVLFIN